MRRSELYALAWSEPLSHLAPRLGYSGRGLGKICAKFNVPVPGRGYWAKRAVGVTPDPRPLPQEQRDELIPALSGLDAHGELKAPEAPDEWIIPGLLKRAPSRGRPAKPGPAVLKRPVYPPTEAPAVPFPCAPDEPPATTPVPIESRMGAQAQPDSEARTAEYHRALEMATKFAQHQPLAAMLASLNATAAYVPKETAEVIRAWTRTVREEMERVEPLAYLAAVAESAASHGRRPDWWPTD